MKGANIFRLRGSHLSFTLITLMFTTIFLCIWEKNPLLTTLLSAQDQFMMPYSVSVINPKEHIEEEDVHSVETEETRHENIEEEDAHSIETEETRNEQKVQEMASTVTFSPNRRDIDRDVTSSSEKKVSVINPKEHTEEEDVHSVETEETRHENIEEEDAHSIETEETRNEQKVQEMASTVTFSPNRKVIDRDVTSSSEKKVSVINPKEHTEEEDVHSVETEETRNESIEEEDAHSIETEETRNEQKVREMASTVTFSPNRKDIDRDVTSSSKKKVCNYAKGRWVEDSRRPLYSGFGCKQWLSEMWACRLSQRTDFSYERYRWQPENCEMPEFEGASFLRRMQDKTIAFVGDSLGRQQFQSLMCMASGWKESLEVEDVGRKYGLVIPSGVIRPDGWAYRFRNTNTTILYYWSASLCDLEPLNITDPASDVAMHLDRPPAFLSRFLHRFDVVVLNTGHHWNRGKLVANKWVMYVNGRPLEDRRLAAIGNAKNFTIYSVARWLDSQLPSHPRLKVFFRTLSPRHFYNGDWNTGGSCDNTTPLASGSEVWQNESSDPVIEGALKGTKVKLLDITAISQLRDEGHISRYGIKAMDDIQDCLHWCLPGIPDTWNELLAAQL